MHIYIATCYTSVTFWLRVLSNSTPTCGCEVPNASYDVYGKSADKPAALAPTTAGCMSHIVCVLHHAQQHSKPYRCTRCMLGHQFNQCHSQPVPALLSSRSCCLGLHMGFAWHIHPHEHRFCLSKTVVCQPFIVCQQHLML